MGGLDYLNKKVWHPGSMKNIQKVWEEEQKQKQINKKGKQRAKKLQQQRHNQQLKRIQVEAGLIPKSHLERMEWLYDWGNKIQQQKTNQQFLTGQKKADPHTRKQFKHTFQQQVTNSKCQDYSLLHQDPMFQIQRKEKERRQALMSNPIQMKQIIKQVQKDYLPKIDRSQSRKHKKSKKHKKDRKEKKHKKQKKHRSRNSSSNSSQSGKSRSNSSSNDRQRSRKHKHRIQRQSDDSSTTAKKSTKQSSLYQQYLKQRFGGNLTKQEDGNLKVDYGLHKKKYKTQFQLDEDERRRKLDQLRGNADKLRQERQQERNRKVQEQDQEKVAGKFDEGVNNIRQQMFSNVKENRNLKRYKHGSDSE